MRFLANENFPGAAVSIRGLSADRPTIEFNNRRLGPRYEVVGLTFPMPGRSCINNGHQTPRCVLQGGMDNVTRIKEAIIDCPKPKN